MSGAPGDSPPAPPTRGGWLDAIERAGNALPDPATLFFAGALGVALLSQLAVGLDWSVTRSVAELDASGQPTGALSEVVVKPVGLLSSEGVYWMLSSLVKNFVEFPPLGVVLVGMLGIGLAEKAGFIGALLKTLLLGVPRSLLTPAMVFTGILSSMGLDAGYVVLPPVAAALYAAVGRSPLAGLAAVFAGVSAGFSANLAVTSLDPLLAGFTTQAARLLDPAYEVAATANLGFMIVSTAVLTLVGWAVTAAWVEPRLERRSPDQGGPQPVETAELAAQQLSPVEKRALGLALLGLVAAFALVLVATWLPGAPLHGVDGKFPRWVRVIVPLIFVLFLVPGLVYGFASGSLKSDKNVARLMGETMASMGPYIVLAFVAAQFIAFFAHSRLGEMLALTGGQLLARAGLPDAGLMVAFIGVVMVGNLFIGSMSAKYAFFAPVFVPMFMQVGISPELTQAAYRVGDSVTNVITPLNPYMVILLAFMQRYVRNAGIGSLVALMLPYAIVFAIVWTVLLTAWIAIGIPLGPEGPLTY